jgi:hypothetical protein
MTECQRSRFEPIDFADEAVLIGRLVELRRAGRIGIVLADCGVYYIAEDERDPWGTRRRYSVPELWALVEGLRAAA